MLKVKLHFGKYADSEADKKIDISNIRDKATNNYKQIHKCNGYCIVSEWNIVLKRGYVGSSWCYTNVDWFVNEVMNLEYKMNF